jgi:hypothetical protein
VGVRAGLYLYPVYFRLCEYSENSESTIAVLVSLDDTVNQNYSEPKWASQTNSN